MGRRSGIPVVVDLHEIYPEMVRFTLASAREAPLGKRRSIAFALQSPKWWDRVERMAVRDADRVVVVIDESKRRLIEMGVDEKKVAVVMNATDVDDFLQQAESVPAAEKAGFTCCYVGGMDNPNRGLHNLVQAWPAVLRHIPGATLWLVGDGGVRPLLEKLVHTMGLPEGSIKFIGQVPFNKVAAYVKGADVAIIPHVVNEHTNNTIPHKLFQYIALGKVVVASDIRPIRRILDDTESGVIVNEWSPAGFASAIAIAHKLLQSGHHDAERQVRLLRERYDFRTIEQNLLSLYNGLRRK